MGPACFLLLILELVYLVHLFNSVASTHYSIEAKKVSTNESTSAPFRPNTNFHVLREGYIDDACDCNHTGRDFRVIY